MDTISALGLIQESAYMLAVLTGFLFFALRKGRQTVTNIILGLYLALLISIEFPFYDVLLNNTSSAQSSSILMLIVFTSFTIITTLLFQRILPREYDERVFEGLGRKLLLATAGTALVMTYSYHALPVTDLISPGSPIQYLFGSEQSFFYWLLFPLIILYVT